MKISKYDTLNPQKTNNDVFQIVISAVRGTGSGYVALDNFEFGHSADDDEFCRIRPETAAPTSSTAAPTPSTTEFPAKLPSCQFESDSCDWEIFGLGFHWFITNSQNLTEAGLPGPLAQHEGNYLYASGAAGIPGEISTIVSPLIQSSAEGLCVSFFFSLFVRNLPCWLTLRPESDDNFSMTGESSLSRYTLWPRT